MNTANRGRFDDPALSRRNFLSLISVAGASMSVAGIPSALAASEEAHAATQKNSMPICVFSKPLDGYETEFMADAIAGAGADGFDLTVRPGGKVEPERVEQDLPKFADTVRKHNLLVKMMASAITGADSPHAEKVLKTASNVGVIHYRLGYFDYDFRAGVWESLQRHRSTLAGLVELNRNYHLQAGYQNHSGTHVGAPVWDLHELLRGLPVEQISVQYDVRHATTEGAFSWIIGMRLIRPFIGSLAIKDFTWDVSSGKPRVVSVPLGEGLVDFDAYFKLLKELNIRTPITLHIEYPLLSGDENSRPLLEKQKIITSKLKQDVNYIRAQLAKHQIS